MDRGQDLARKRSPQGMVARISTDLGRGLAAEEVDCIPRYALPLSFVFGDPWFEEVGNPPRLVCKERRWAHLEGFPAQGLLLAAPQEVSAGEPPVRGYVAGCCSSLSGQREEEGLLEASEGGLEVLGMEDLEP